MTEIFMQLPLIELNWVDLGIAAILFFYLWIGTGRGFVMGIFDLTGFIASFFLSLKYYSILGAVITTYVAIGRGIANAIGFLITGIFIETIFAIFVNILVRKLYRHFFKDTNSKNRLTVLFGLDKLLGVIPASGEAIILIAFFLTLLVSLPVQGAIKQRIISSYLGGPLIVHTQGIEYTLNKVFGEAVNESLTFLTINPSPISDETVDLGFVQASVKVDETAEVQMASLINHERTTAGLDNLTLSDQLRELSRSYARDMFAHGYFSHYNLQGDSPFDRMKKAGIVFGAAGENLALAPNVVLAHQGLMNSPGHRANILSSDFRKVGIGVIDGGIYGEMFVQEFTD